MKTFIHFLSTEIALVCRARVTLFWTFAFPIFMLVVQMALFGHDPASISIKVGLADLDQSEASKRYVAFVTRGFTIQQSFRATVTPLKEAPKTPEPYDIVVVVPHDFGLGAASGDGGVIQVSRSAGQIASGAAQSILQGITTEYNMSTAKAPRAAIIEATTVGTVTKRIPYSLYLVTGLSFMVILSTSLMGFASPLVGSRESGVFRIYHLYPMPPLAALAAFWLARLVIVASSITLLFAVAATLYRVPITGSFSALLLGFGGLFLGTAGFLSLGLVIASFSRNSQTTTMVCNVLYSTLLFSGNLLLPTSGLPAKARAFVEFLPLNAMAGTVRRCFSGQPDFSKEAVTYGLMILVTGACLALTHRSFRWTPQRLR